MVDVEVLTASPDGSKIRKRVILVAEVSVAPGYPTLARRLDHDRQSSHGTAIYPRILAGRRLVRRASAGSARRLQPRGILGCPGRKHTRCLPDDERGSAGSPSLGSVNQGDRCRGLKRRDLIRHLESAGCLLKRHGGGHDIYVNPSTGKTAPVPRHSEIKDSLANLIRKQLRA